MLQAIHLSEDEAFVSNIIKCGIDHTVQPKAENIDACVSYLERQIAATSPEIICTMGIAATRTLLHIARPLSQLRGKFYQYHLDKHRSIPLLPTYHPTFLLKNPEMKRATWEDLQLIEKHLRR
jgi:DNA polymerase